MPGPDTAAAKQHLEEMRDLAERILAMGNTLEARETGKPTVAVWDLGAELAELVRHYEPPTLDSEEITYEICSECSHFVEETGYGNPYAASVHLDDGEKDHDHDANPSGDRRTLAAWKAARPDLFETYADGKIGPNSVQFNG